VRCAQQRCPDGAHDAVVIAQHGSGHEDDIPAEITHLVQPSAVPVERPRLPVTPVAVVLDRKSVLRKREIDSDDPVTVTVDDPVLRDRLESGLPQHDPHLGLRQRLGERVGQLDRASGPDDALSDRAATIAATASRRTRRARNTASRSATASGSGRPSSRSSVSRIGVASLPPAHEHQSAGVSTVRRTSRPRRCPSRVSGGTTTWIGSSGQASRTPRTVAADRPVITALDGNAMA
jgi:hypothetical protein